jgi:hypothetical protein
VNWGSVNASLELIAVLASGASTIRIASTIGNRAIVSGFTVNASLELIAVLSSWARAVGVAGTIRNGAIVSRGSWDAEVELIAVVIGGTVSICGALDAVSVDGLSSDASLEFVTVVACRTSSIRCASIGKSEADEYSHGEGDLKETSHSSSYFYINIYNCRESFIFL